MTLGEDLRCEVLHPIRLGCQKFASSIHGCWERNANQSLSVTPMEHDIPTVIPTTKSRDGIKAMAFWGRGKAVHLVFPGMHDD